jgi:hypothetical protein
VHPSWRDNIGCNSQYETVREFLSKLIKAQGP